MSSTINNSAPFGARSIDKVLRALEERECRPRQTGPNQWKALCCGHDDHNPSLSVSYESGTTGLWCHTGCDTEQVVDALALDMSDLFDDDRVVFDGWTRASFEKTKSPGKYLQLCESPQATSTSEGPPLVKVAVDANADAYAYAYRQASLDAEDTGGSEESKKIGSDAIFSENEPLFQRMAEYKAGRMVPDFEVRLRIERLPRNASTLRAVAERIALVMSLQLTDGDPADPALSCTVVAWLMGLDPEKGAKQASKWLHALERYHVIRQSKTLPPLKGQPCGTRCFQPYDFELVELLAFPGAGTSAEEPSVSLDVPEEVTVSEPLVEVPDEGTVDGAELGEPGADTIGVIASGHTTGSETCQFGHATKYNGPIGRKMFDVE